MLFLATSCLVRTCPRYHAKINMYSRWKNRNSIDSTISYGSPPNDVAKPRETCLSHRKYSIDRGVKCHGKNQNSWRVIFTKLAIRQRCITSCHLVAPISLQMQKRTAVLFGGNDSAGIRVPLGILLLSREKIRLQSGDVFQKRPRYKVAHNSYSLSTINITVPYIERFAYRDRLNYLLW